MKRPITVGSFEVVSFPDLGLEDLVAKVDTGAYSGALHCSEIKVIRQGLKREKVLRFKPHDKPDFHHTKQFTERHVRSASGHRKKRYIIDTSITLQGVSYPISIGLSNRSTMKRPVLIGRKFLRENNLLVDVSLNTEYDEEGVLYP